MKDNDLEKLFSAIEQRYLRLGDNTEKRKAFLDHLSSLGTWEEDVQDYPKLSCNFPEAIDVAFAVCHPTCATREFIVEGSTQECQRCGALLFRQETMKYIRGN